VAEVCILTLGGRRARLADLAAALSDDAELTRRAEAVFGYVLARAGRFGASVDGARDPVRGAWHGCASDAPARRRSELRAALDAIAYETVVANGVVRLVHAAARNF